MATRFEVRVNDIEVFGSTTTDVQKDYGRYLTAVETAKKMIWSSNGIISKQIDAVITEHDMTTHQTVIYTE